MKSLIIVPRIPDNTTATKQYQNDISKRPLIKDQDHEAKLAKEIRGGNESALQELVEANLRFVVSVAKQYQHRGLPLDDMISEGNIGLIKAARKFDETKGFKFISYAVWWIRQSIEQALRNNDIIRVPVNKNEEYMNLEKSKIEFLQKNHREPATEELASICGMSIEKISNIMTAKERTISLDASIATESGSHSLLSILESNAEGIKLQDQQTHTKEICDKLLSTLSDQEQDILRAKFGICLEGDEFPLTEEDIYEKYKINSDQVRYRTNSIEKKLKRNKKKIYG